MYSRVFGSGRENRIGRLLKKKTTTTTTTTTTRADIFSFDFFSQEEEPPNTGGDRFYLPRCNLWLLATASASAPAMFLALRSALLCACV